MSTMPPGLSCVRLMCFLYYTTDNALQWISAGQLDMVVCYMFAALPNHALAQAEQSYQIHAFHCDPRFLVVPVDFTDHTGLSCVFALGN